MSPARRPSVCAQREARKKFRATALEFAVIAAISLALPIASFQLGQTLGHKVWPQEWHADAVTYAAAPGIIISEGGRRPWSANEQPDATPAPISKGAARSMPTPAPGACHADAHALLGLSPAAAATAAHSCR